jgi:hypothetical protein
VNVVVVNEVGVCVFWEKYLFVVVGRKGERTGADITVAGFVETEDDGSRTFDVMV